MFLFLVAAVAPAQEPGPPADAVPRLVVPEGPAPELDGKFAEEAWKGGASFAVMRGKQLVGHGRLLRSGRQLYIAYSSEFNPWALGVRFNFTDPVSNRSNLVLVQPLSPPMAPLALFRQLPERPAEPVSCVPAEIRFDLSPATGFSFEARLPLDLLEVPRSNQALRFTVETWDLQAQRPLGYFPLLAAGVGGAQIPARLEPRGDWGKDAAAGPEQRHEAFTIFDEIASERMEAPSEGEDTRARVLRAFAGWEDGRRRDAPLAAFEARLVSVIEKYPDYVSLLALLVQVRQARNNGEGALAAHREMRKRFPLLAQVPFHALAESELLRSVQRYGEAAKLLRSKPALLKEVDVARRELVLLEGLVSAQEREDRVRAEEAKRDDLPRARIEIKGKGAIVLELLEDDAPNAVANFVSLVERGYYTGTRFHWVTGGRRAIGGDPNSKDEVTHNDGFGDPGYLIESEPSRRLHLPFMVAFTDKRRARRTEGSAFVIHLAPQPDLDGVSSVFARVIDGHDVVRKIEYYDEIEKASILRKRDHVYEPVKRTP